MPIHRSLWASDAARGMQMHPGGSGVLFQDLSVLKQIYIETACWSILTIPTALSHDV